MDAPEPLPPRWLGLWAYTTTGWLNLGHIECYAEMLDILILTKLGAPIFFILPCRRDVLLRMLRHGVLYCKTSNNNDSEIFHCLEILWL
jgi:hypothetical protein